MKCIELTITRQHLKDASFEDGCRTCLVATAIKAKFPDARYISVGFCTAQIDDKEYSISKRGERIIRKFMDREALPVRLPVAIRLVYLDF